MEAERIASTLQDADGQQQRYPDVSQWCASLRALHARAHGPGAALRPCMALQGPVERL